MDGLKDVVLLTKAQKALERILAQLEGMDKDDMTTAEINIKRIAERALEELTE